MDKSKVVARIHKQFKTLTKWPPILEQEIKGFMKSCSNVGTAKIYYGDLRRFIVFISMSFPEIRKSGLRGVTREMVDDFRWFISRYGGKEKKGVSPSTVNRHLAAISKFFKYLGSVEGYRNIQNPVYNIEKPKVPKEVQTQGVPSHKVKEILSLTSSETFTDSLHQVILYLSFGTGLRNDELRSLKLEDFKIEDGIGKLKVHSTKSNKIIIKKLPHASSEALIYYLDLCKKEGMEMSPTNYLLRSLDDQVRGTSRKSEKMAYGTFLYVFKKYGKKVGIEKLTPHVARVTFITTLLDAGNSVNEVKEEVGHTNSEMTFRYYKQSASEKRDLRSDLDYLK